MGGQVRVFYKRMSLCAIVKDERPLDLIEWLQYHKSLGFSEFILFDNNDEPQVAPLMKAIGFQASVIHYPGKRKQLQAYTDALAVFTGDWCLFLDCDEYLCVNNSVFFLELFDQGLGQVSINWLGRGQPGLANSTPGMKLLEFQRFSNSVEFNSHVKTFVKRGERGTWMDPHFLCTGKRQISGGIELFSGPRHPPDGLQTARIHHIFTGSLEDWGRKVARGRADTGGTRSWKEYETFNASCQLL